MTQTTGLDQYRQHPVVHVHCVGHGEPVLISRVEIGDEHFDEQLAHAQAIAEERASTFNAQRIGL